MYHKENVCEFYPFHSEDGPICDAGSEVTETPCTKDHSLICECAAEHRKEIRKHKITTMLGYLTKKASELKQKDLDWAIKMEDAFKSQNETLSDKQYQTLEDIFKRY